MLWLPEFCAAAMKFWALYEAAAASNEGGHPMFGNDEPLCNSVNRKPQ